MEEPGPGPACRSRARVQKGTPHTPAHPGEATDNTAVRHRAATAEIASDRYRMDKACGVGLVGDALMRSP